MRLKRLILKTLKRSSITVGCLVFLVIVIWSCHFPVRSTSSNSSEQGLFKGQAEHATWLRVSGFLLDSAKGVRKTCSSLKAVPSELPGILWFVWFDTTHKSVPIHFCSFFRTRERLAVEPVKV